jgi:hypothetical protein
MPQAPKVKAEIPTKEITAAGDEGFRFKAEFSRKGVMACSEVRF